MPDDTVSRSGASGQGNGMGKKIGEIRAKIGSDPGIAEVLDHILTGPDDRAYIVCQESGCRKNIKGRCSIHTVRSRRDTAGGRCRDYEV